MILSKLQSIDIKSFLIDRELNDTLQVIKETIDGNKDEIVDQTQLHSLSMAQVIQTSGKPIQIGPDLLTDIEMFQTYQGDNDTKANSIFSKIDHCFTQGGKQFLTKILSKPIDNLDLLRSRSNAIQSIESKLDSITPLLRELHESESAVAWVYNSDKEELIHMYDMVYFSTWFTRPLNKQDKVLTAYNIYRVLVSPAIGILSPICYVIVPFMILRKQLGIKIHFFTYVKYMVKMMFASDAMIALPASLSSLKYLSFAFTLIFYFQGVFNSIELAGAVNRICSLITQKVNGFIRFIKAAAQLLKLIDSSYVSHFFDCTSIDISPALDTFESFTINKYSLIRNFGKQLSIFKYIDKNDYKPLINSAYIIDSLSSIAILANAQKVSYVTFAYDEKNKGKPYVSLIDMWHPCLDDDKVVKNSLQVGGDKSNNIILTGPNAGGKSTLIKSLLVNVVLAQACGVACAKHATLAPFHLINSQINIPDCKGRESLFEAEMYRSKGNLDALSALDHEKTALIVMDEIFNSTNPVEGIAGAYAIAKHMATHKNASCVITTHYLYLTKLAKDCPNVFTNYRMNVNIHEGTGEIEYPYKLGRGVSRQFIALELLKKNGFDLGLINDAIAIKDKFTSALKQVRTECDNDVSIKAIKDVSE